MATGHMGSSIGSGWTTYFSAFAAAKLSASLLSFALLWLIVSGSTEAFSFMKRRDRSGSHQAEGATSDDAKGRQEQESKVSRVNER
jgi:hypothetical protein